MKIYKIAFVIIFSVFFPFQKNAAQNIDSLFTSARALALQHKTVQARVICVHILTIKPDYTDALLLRGRTYSWDRNFDSARIELQKAYKLQPSYQDVSIALIDNEIWADDFDQAGKLVDESLAIFPKNTDFLWRKAHILQKLEKFKDALNVMDILLEIQPENEEYKRFRDELKISMSRQKIVIDYAFDYYSVPYLRKTHIFSLSYILKTDNFSLNPRISSGHLISNESVFFQDRDIQAELDAYINLTKKSYFYFNAGFAATPFFPKKRLGLEYTMSLPFSTEASVGYRYLQYISPAEEIENISIFTISIGLYLGDFWFSLRPFITPKDGEVSKTYIFTTRMYFENPDNYLTLILASGNSPDDPTRNITQLEVFRLKSFNMRMGVQYRLNTFLTTKLSLGYAKEEYLNSQYRNSFNSNVAVSFNF